MGVSFANRTLMVTAAVTMLSATQASAVSAAPVATLFMVTLDYPYGGAIPCLSGYVWREAGAGDYVCVLPSSRDRARSDNSKAPLRTLPFGAYGSGTCLPGYVWREAFSGDHVCVKPKIRDRSAQENAEATMHRADSSYPPSPYPTYPTYPTYPPYPPTPTPMPSPPGAAIPCQPGYVWREAGPGDYVCVDPASRARSAQENALAPSRVNPYGPYGPQTCVSGYVWREAFANDKVCVTPDIRSLVQNENAMGPSHRQITFIPPIYIPVPPLMIAGTCLSGFVWREARSDDHVCVEPGSRSRAAMENSMAASRVNPYGPYGPSTCISGYVWREAYPGDQVCVTPDIRSLVQSENAMASSRAVH